jgi:three-Cys-motif partner protein
MGDTSKFFESLKGHSEIKHRILGKFLPPWRAKLGLRVSMRGTGRLWYVDAFAGTGKYEDGADGSPIIGARQALAAKQEKRDYRLACINVEIKRDRFQLLVANTADFISADVEIHNLLNDFSLAVPEIMNLVGSQDPILLFVDPFGIKPLVFDAIRPLLSRPGPVDLILTFNTAALHRLVVDHPHLVTQAIGNDAWLKDWNLRGPKAVLADFGEQLVKVGRFLPVASYPVRDEEGGPAHYHLLVASRHEDAYVLSNDSVCEEDVRLKDYNTILQGSLLEDWDKEQDQRELIEAILDRGRVTRVTSRKAIRNDLVITRWGHWHTKDVNKAVNALVESGRVKRQREGDIDTDPLIFDS